jgi:hypothetical protein
MSMSHAELAAALARFGWEFRFGSNRRVLVARRGGVSLYFEDAASLLRHVSLKSALTKGTNEAS